MKRLLNFKETRDFLHVSQTTLYRWIYNKKIPALKIGGQWRFDEKALNDWINSKGNRVK
ncbi:MAG: helix-turn-helix domain-containing protein [Candidatus Omnitrophica bacterium]|nr:helix-turn-helix domain-containing protein [Candidatus Omnitrophota bacterium]